MFEQLPYYQNKGKIGYRPGLDRVRKLADYLGNPQSKLKLIHIAGTNGKGSTAHLIASVLMESGYKTGLFISPHFLDYRERITIGGKKIPKEFVLQFINSHFKVLSQWGLSFFEMNIGLALEYFRYEKVDYAILEVGLGGRLDATNIVCPILSVITNIGLDHTEYLGDTLEKIAYEKGGIIKNKVPVLIGQRQNGIDKVFENISRSLDAPLYYSQPYPYMGELTPNWPKYQYKNIQTAHGALDLLRQIEKIDLQIVKGINNTAHNTSFMGRWQVISQQPLVVLDVAHNIEGFKEILAELESITYEKLHLVMGFVKGREHKSIFRLLSEKGILYLSTPKVERAKSKSELLNDLPGDLNFHHQYHPSIEEAFDYALSRAVENDMILVCGSTFVVAEIIDHLKRRKCRIDFQG